MSTLLMQIRAPMVSWGDHSRFTVRDTRLEPTKSAIVGLLCAALGRSRGEAVNDLASLTMGVRVDKEGIVQCDYHTVIGSAKTTISHRYFVADAAYIVGLEGERTQLELLAFALQTPCWSLFFGRKSFVPSSPIYVGIQDLPLLQALQEFPYRPSGKKTGPFKLRFVLEVADSLDVRRDVPLDWHRRFFGSRCVETTYLEVDKTCTSRA